MSELNIVSANTFNERVLQSNTPIVVDFWAAWCPPCKKITPMLEQASVDYEGRLQIVKVDCDQDQKLASEYNIRNIPALILFNNGKEVKRRGGVLNRSTFDDFVKDTVR
ncbi:MAG: thioredoxin [Myxococcota bacterium]|nr:thioredoxin [Myxococcota bacterium]